MLRAKTISICAALAVVSIASDSLAGEEGASSSLTWSALAHADPAVAVGRELSFRAYMMARPLDTKVPTTLMYLLPCGEEGHLYVTTLDKGAAERVPVGHGQSCAEVRVKLTRHDSAGWHATLVAVGASAPPPPPPAGAEIEGWNAFLRLEPRDAVGRVISVPVYTAARVPASAPFTYLGACGARGHFINVKVGDGTLTSRVPVSQGARCAQAKIKLVEHGRSGWRGELLDVSGGEASPSASPTSPSASPASPSASPAAAGELSWEALAGVDPSSAIGKRVTLRAYLDVPATSVGGTYFPYLRVCGASGHLYAHTADRAAVSRIPVGSGAPCAAVTVRLASHDKAGWHGALESVNAP